MADPKDELRLVLLAQCDDRQALEALFLSVQPDLARYIAGLVVRTAADDVLQDVYVKLWRNLKWLHRPELFRPWAYRIAGRTCLRHLKRERRWHSDIGLDHLQGAGAEPAGDVERLLEHASAASRAVLLLHYGQDLPIEQAAAILGIATGTAKSRLSYGLSCLRKLLTAKG